jgi:hypothetical protein
LNINPDFIPAQHLKLVIGTKIIIWIYFKFR